MISVNRARRSSIACWVAIWCMAWPALEAAAPIRSFAQTSPSVAPVERGQEYYDQSRFDDAISLLKDLDERGALTGPDQQLAREILARSYVKKGYPVQAREMFKKILAENAAYRPDPIRVPPDEMAVFEGAKQEFDAAQAAPKPTGITAEPKPSPPPVETGTQPPKLATPLPGVSAQTSSKKSLLKRWYFWVGLAAVGGGAALALGGGGDGGGGGGPELPGFPSRP